jgi:outer membrane protein assembly factor BamB
MLHAAKRSILKAASAGTAFRCSHGLAQSFQPVIIGIVKLTMHTTALSVLLISVATTMAGELAGADWPQFLGPTRNGIYGGLDVAENWASNGPPVVWQEAVGHGFSGPVVADHKLILFHRLDDKETLECLDARTGSPMWRFAYPTRYQDEFGFDDGPRSTPTIAGGRVYTFGAEGMLHCIDFESGKPLWSLDVKADFQAPNGFFGMACSPLVEGDGVLLNIGGAKGAGVVCRIIPLGAPACGQQRQLAQCHRNPKRSEVGKG